MIVKVTFYSAVNGDEVSLIISADSIQAAEIWAECICGDSTPYCISTEDPDSYDSMLQRLSKR